MAMMEGTKEFLRNLRKSWENMDEVAKREVWVILTALRGPDHGDFDLKSATTSLIRGAVLGNIPNAFSETVDSARFLEIRCDTPGRYDHFVNHASQAFDVLGLAWFDRNGFVYDQVSEEIQWPKT